MKLTKFLRLPTPKETGKSKYNSLPMEGLGAKPGDFTWEVYFKEMKEKYPIRYFINEYIPRIFRRRISNPLENFRYWIVSHTIRKYHLLDLRNNEYKWGWRDCDTQLLYASMAIMENFIAEQDTENHLIWLREKLLKDIECKDPFWKDSIKFCEDLLEIQKWWREEYSKYELDFDRINENYDKATEMIKKVADMRAGMWT